MSSTLTSVHDVLSCNDSSGADCIDGYPIVEDTCEYVTVVFEIIENVFIESGDIKYESTTLDANEFECELHDNDAKIEFIPDTTEEPTKQEDAAESNVPTTSYISTQYGQDALDKLLKLGVLLNPYNLFPSIAQPTTQQCSESLLTIIFEKVTSAYYTLRNYEQMAIDNVDKLSMLASLAVVYKAIKYNDQIAVNIITKILLSVSTLAAVQLYDTPNTFRAAKFLIEFYSVWLIRNCMYLLSDKDSKANLLPPGHADVNFLNKLATLVKLRVYSQAIVNRVDDIENQLFFYNLDAKKYKPTLEPFITKRFLMTSYKSVTKDGIKKAFSSEFKPLQLPDIIAHGTANFFIANAHNCDPKSYFIYQNSSTSEFLKCSSAIYGKTLAVATGKSFGEYTGSGRIATFVVDNIVPFMNKIIPERFQVALDTVKFTSLGGGVFLQLGIKKAVFDL